MPSLFVPVMIYLKQCFLIRHLTGRAEGQTYCRSKQAVTMVTTTDKQKQAWLGHIPVELGFGYKYASRAVLWLSSYIG